ncbi:MAG: acyltransferase family protein, partial [Acidimicrobiales bacterium]
GVAALTYIVAALTYIVAAIPVMFFVTGSLLAQSASRRSISVVVGDRIRRLLLPFWLFAATAWIVMAAAALLTDSQLHAARVFTWIMPFTDPRGSEWEAGWLSSHLWYLRAMLWIFALSPLLLIAYRRQPIVLMVTLVATVFLLDAVDRSPSVSSPILRALCWRVVMSCCTGCSSSVVSRIETARSIECVGRTGFGPRSVSGWRPGRGAPRNLCRSAWSTTSCFDAINAVVTQLGHYEGN